MMQDGSGRDEIETGVGDGVLQDVSLDEGNSGGRCAMFPANCASANDGIAVAIDAGDLAAIRGKPARENAGTASDIKSRPALRRYGAHNEIVVVDVVIPRRSHEI
jgi:hypothetical protein